MWTLGHFFLKQTNLHMLCNPLLNQILATRNFKKHILFTSFKNKSPTG
jgi:hypothetical protein